MDAYTKRFPRATQCLENGLEDSLTFYAFPKLDARKISSSNMIERLNREIRRRTSAVGIFPNEASYIPRWQRISWNMLRTGLFPELTLAKNLLRQRCSWQLDFIL